MFRAAPGCASAGPRRRPGTDYTLFALAGLLSIGLAACGGPAGGDGSDDDRVGSPGPTAAERRAIHDGLDRIGRACSPKNRSPRAERITAPEVRMLLTFRRRFPTQRFAIDQGGETGTMVSVLLVARAEVLGCSRAGVEAIDRVLPAQIRSALPPARAAPAP